MYDFERWLPLRQIAEDGGTGGGVEAPDAGGEAPPPPSGPGSGRSELRQQLEKNFETDRKAAEKAEAAPKRGKAPKRVAGGAEIAEPEAPKPGAEAVEGAQPGTEGQPAPQAAVAAPEGLSAEAKAEWAKTPAIVQQAVAKRLADAAKGVEELKGKYKDLDTALAPHLEAIRRHGHSPAQAVNQLFSWFQALAANPAVAFPALAKSFNLDLAQLVAPQQPQQQAQPGQEQQQQPQGAIPPEVQKYINGLETKLSGLEQAFTQKIGAVEQTFAQQTEAKTNEILSAWAKDKPHYEAVRQHMASLIASGAVPLKNGQVDLDTAYDMAIWGVPDVRSQVLAAQQAAAQKAAADKAAAEKKAQQEQADKARKAAVSISGAAPGVPGGPGGKPTGKRKTVRESIMEAREQLSEQ